MPPPNTPTPEYATQLNEDAGSQNPPTSSRVTRSRYQPLNLVANTAEAPRSTKSTSSSLDMQSLTYLGPVDENLICPICRVALVDPVDTECDHTFCRDCIVEALSHSELCPIDRFPLSRQSYLGKTNKIIINQLDALLAKCPCCETGIPRSMLQNHIERYCQDALVPCIGPNCDQAVRREISDRGCLHYDSTCPDCHESHQQIDMANHREYQCKEREKSCEHCGWIILRCEEVEHMEECEDIISPCRWAKYGCQHESKRKDLVLHADDCHCKLVGPIAETLTSEINSLQADLRALTQKDQLQERRIKFLEHGQRNPDRTLDYSDLPSQQLTNFADSSTSAEPLDSAHEYLLSLVEAQESKIDRLSANMTELEAKQTMMLFNETLPIKTDLSEMRSSQQILGMHVRWLLNFRRQENQRRSGGGPSTGGGADAGGSGDGLLPRRSSDLGTRDIITKL